MQRKPRPKFTAAELAVARTEPLPDEPPANMDHFRLMLARRIAMFMGDRLRSWRGCKEPGCRRARRCLAPQIRCTNRPPLPPAAPDDWARTSALIQRAVKKRQAQIAAGE